jgi:hypothetical protein
MIEIPKELGFYMPAEWGKLSAVWLAWPYDDTTFPNMVSDIEKKYCEIIKSLEDSEKVNLIVLDIKTQNEVEILLKSFGINLNNIVFYIQEYADVWVRDYAPITLINKNINELAFVKWEYNAYGKKDDPYFADLLKDNNYIMLFNITKKLNEKYNYGISITNSNDIIAYNMILMNYYSSRKLLEYNNGIFRSIIINDIDISLSNKTIPLSILNFVKIYNSNNSSKYININNNKENIAHNILKLDSYIHITSPIRRIPDILNMIKLQQNLNMINFKNNVDIFYEKWIDNIDYINKSMKNIKKIQNECYLLSYCSNNNDILQNVYDGYIIDKHIEEGKINNIITYKYLVYINVLNIVMSIKLNNRSLNLYDINKYQLYIFNDEDKFKKKIRLNIVN